MNSKVQLLTPIQNQSFFPFRQVGLALALGLAALQGWRAQAQPAVVSTVPAMLATGVSPSAAVVITFSEPMDTTATVAQFLDPLNPMSPLPTTPSWDATGTVLTCAPNPAFPANRQIVWEVAGQNPNGDPLGGNTGGIFTTGSGGGSTSSGSGTNAITTFTLGKMSAFEQGAPGAPQLSTNAPFVFSALTTLASNRTATAITLTTPTSAVSNLTQNFLEKEGFYLFGSFASSNSLEAAFPQGAYTFNVAAATSNQSVSFMLPVSMTQPDAPHVSNYAAAQAVSASQPFALNWDAFTDGTSADYISVDISSTTNVWKSLEYRAVGALNGTATSVTIPAGALQAGLNYSVNLAFYHIIWSSNVTYATAAYRASVTQFNLTTVGSLVPAPVVSNPAWAGTGFGFDVTTTSGQILTVLSTTNCSLPLSSWQPLLTTNSPGSKVHIVDPSAATRAATYYSVRNGP